jgi:hypothetical protein
MAGYGGNLPGNGVVFDGDGRLASKSRETVPAQPVDATPSNQLICQHFSSRVDLYGRTQSEPKQGSVPFESTLANEITLVDSYKKTSSKCCNDPLRPPRFSGPICSGIGTKPNGCEISQWFVPAVTEVLQNGVYRWAWGWGGTPGVYDGTKSTTDLAQCSQVGAGVL